MKYNYNFSNNIKRFYTEEELKRFYKRLGYTLLGPFFNQELTKMDKFFYTKDYKLILLNFKFNQFLKHYLKNKKKNLLVTNKKALSFLLQYDKLYKKIKFLKRDKAFELFYEKMKYSFINISKKRVQFFLNKLIRNLYFKFKLNLKLLKRRQLRIKRNKRKYKIKRKPYKLILKNTNSNFFIILTTLKGKVIWYCTSGQVCQFYNIRRKKSHLLIKDIMYRFNKKLRTIKIKYLKIFIRSYITKHIRKVIIFLDNKRIKTKYIIFNRPFPHHNGQRKKKLRRI